MYIYLQENIVQEIIPDIDPVFPGVPINRRYAAGFVKKLMHVPNGTEVEQNWIYDPEKGTFHEPPPPPEPEPWPEPEPSQPSNEQRLAALEEAMLALMMEV